MVIHSRRKSERKPEIKQEVITPVIVVEEKPQIVETVSVKTEEQPNNKPRKKKSRS